MLYSGNMGLVLFIFQVLTLDRLLCITCIFVQEILIGGKKFPDEINFDELPRGDIFYE